MAIDPLPHAMDQADGLLLIPKVTFDYMKAALSDFEEGLTKPELAYFRDSVRGMRKVMQTGKVQARGDVLLSPAARKFLARCMHDLHGTFLGEGQRGNEITLASLEEALRIQNVGEVIDPRDELLTRALAD